ncbi:MAG: beta-lactamase family protein [Deltaproteobacteria bacterium]|nr:beta-lactamase family protein [Deltaproteobacteria bacterium]
MFESLITKCRVPRDLRAVTRVQSEAEVDPRAVGLAAEAPERIWAAVERLYASGIHPAIQICLRRHGQVILNRSIGHASGNGPNEAPDARSVVCTPDTPFNIFSASKAITAMLVHLLNQRGEIHLDDPVCEYIPEFARHKKQWITLRHLLSHRAGIPNLPPEAMDLRNLEHPERIVELVCDLKPSWRAGRQLAYHAMTSGFVIGEVVRRVTGKDIRTFLTDEIRRPLGFRWLNYGVARRDLPRVAKNYFTGPPPLPPLSNLLHSALGVEFREACRISNEPRFLLNIVPSGNIVTTADELSRFYQMLLDGGTLGGKQILNTRTVKRSRLEQSYLEIDLSLGMPFRYSLGFMLGADYLSIYGPDTRHAFGHLGFTNIVSWADPERHLAGAIMTSGKPLVYAQIYYAWDLMRQIGQLCPKEPRHKPSAKVVPLRTQAGGA